MKSARLILQVGLLYGCYEAGNWVQRWLDLVIPGNIIGMLLLFTLLILKVIPETWIAQGAGFLLAYLPLLFIPVTVGVMDYYHIFYGKGVFLFFIALISTIFVMVISGRTSQWLSKRKGKQSCRHG